MCHGLSKGIEGLVWLTHLYMMSVMPFSLRYCEHVCGYIIKEWVFKHIQRMKKAHGVHFIVIVLLCDCVKCAWALDWDNMVVLCIQQSPYL